MEILSSTVVVNPGGTELRGAVVEWRPQADLRRPAEDVNKKIGCCWLEKKLRSNLPKQVAIFPTGFPTDFVCGQLAVKVINGYDVTTPPCDVVIASQAPEWLTYSHMTVGTCNDWKFEDQVVLQSFSVLL